MPRKPTQHVDRTIARLVREKTTHAQIATVLRRQGHKITASGVTRAVARLGLSDPHVGAPGPAKPKKAKLAPPVAAPGEPELAPEEHIDAEDVRARVIRSLDALERAAQQAEADRDVQRLVSCQRAITSATTLLQRVTPAPPLDPNDAPDMVALRIEAARRWHEMIDMVADDMEGVG